jgi:prefoldin subunit 5
VKRHNPPDLTGRQLRALHKRIQTLERMAKDDRRRIDLIERGATKLNQWVRQLQAKQ